MEEKMVAYLLGELPEEEQIQLEQQFLEQAELYELLLATEEDLADSYARGELSFNQRNHFEKFFLNSSERCQQVLFAETLNDFLDSKAHMTSTSVVMVQPDSTPWWSFVLEFFNPRHWSLRFSTVMAGILFILTGFSGSALLRNSLQPFRNPNVPSPSVNPTPSTHPYHPKYKPFTLTPGRPDPFLEIPETSSARTQASLPPALPPPFDDPFTDRSPHTAQLNTGISLTNLPTLVERETLWKNRCQNNLNHGLPPLDESEKYLIEELNVVGIFEKDGKIGAILQPKGSSGNITVHEGSQFWNGFVQKIEKNPINGIQKNTVVGKVWCLEFTLLGTYQYLLPYKVHS